MHFVQPHSRSTGASRGFRPSYMEELRGHVSALRRRSISQWDVSPTRFAKGDAIRVEARMTEKKIDAESVRQIQAGNLEAFDSLVRKYHRRLVHVVLPIVHNPSDAEDVVQDTFLRAYRALSLFRGDAAFYTWLFRIAVNTAKNFAIGRSRRACVSVQAEGEDGSSVSLDAVAACTDCPLAMLENKQAVEAVGMALQTMPPQLSLALTMLEVEGMSYLDIAGATGCPIGMVRSRIFRARELIAARLAPIVEERLR